MTARVTVKIVRSHLKSPVVTVNVEEGAYFTSYSDKATESSIAGTVEFCRKRALEMLTEAKAGPS